MNKSEEIIYYLINKISQEEKFETETTWNVEVFLGSEKLGISGL